jgi:hypothetical protein
MKWPPHELGWFPGPLEQRLTPDLAHAAITLSTGDALAHGATVGRRRTRSEYGRRDRPLDRAFAEMPAGGGGGRDGGR